MSSSDAEREPLATLGRYALRSKLGAGGMGVVYEAHDPLLDRAVAIKLISASRSDTARERLKREATALARLSHPNVVEIYEIGEDDGRLFIVMERIHGPTLGAWQARRPAPSWRECVKTYLQAAEGLAAAHAAGLVHRDFKPSNCMLGEDGRVRVLDFGLVKAIGDVDLAQLDPTPDALDLKSASTTKSGVVVGTLAYMPLEQLLRGVVDARADQYAFCVSLYEAVYGTLPVLSEDATQAVLSLRRGLVQPPPEVTAVPVALRSVLLRGLSRDPEDRWPSMEALVLALRRVLESPRRRLMPAALVGVLVPIAVLPWIGGSGDDPACEVATLRGVWDDLQRERVRTAILATAVPYAPDTAERLGAALDRYAADWEASRAAACEAPAGAEASVVDRHIDCLNQRRLALRSAVEALAHATAAQVPNAVQSVAALPSPTRCGDVDALWSAPEPPSEPAVAAEVKQLEVRLDEVSTMILLAAHESAREALAQLRGRVEALGYAPLQAQLDFIEGSLLAAEGRYEAAEQRMERSYLAAVEHGHDALARKAAMELTDLVGGQLGRYEDGARWGRAALVLTEAPSVDPVDRAWAYVNLGIVLHMHGELDEALSLYRRALELHREHLDPSHYDVAESMMRVGVVLQQQGDRDAALEMLRGALPIYEQALGPGHPAVGNCLSNLGTMLMQQDPEQGVALLRRAVAVITQSLGDEHPQLAYPLTSLGQELARRGELEPALEHHRRALALFERSLGADHPNLAVVHTNMGDVLLELRRLDEARTHYQRALAIAEAAFGPTSSDAVMVRIALARVALGEGDHAAARELAEAALTAAASGEPRSMELVHARLTLAEALWPDERERPRARALAREAIEVVDADRDADPGAIAEARRWQAEHPQ